MEPVNHEETSHAVTCDAMCEILFLGQDTSLIYSSTTRSAGDAELTEIIAHESPGAAEPQPKSFFRQDEPK
jgi:hypothetical protein